jgi:2-amino-4-hydroxy-6-hydroxymethyldihydropteridine diphosphokinase
VYHPLVDAYIGLGSNLGDRRARLRRAVADLSAAGLRPTEVSSVWETEPIDVEPPLWFLNMAARLETGLAPLDLLDVLLDLERRAGRVRGASGAPRELDLDLLVMDDLRVEHPRLLLPHPRMWQRRFVLEPLAEIAPGLRNPATGRTVVEERDRLRDGPAVRKFGRLDRDRRLPV